jgi:hypothetical protein
MEENVYDEKHANGCDARGCVFGCTVGRFKMPQTFLIGSPCEPGDRAELGPDGKIHAVPRRHVWIWDKFGEYCKACDFLKTTDVGPCPGPRSGDDGEGGR